MSHLQTTITAFEKKIENLKTSIRVGKEKELTYQNSADSTQVRSQKMMWMTKKSSARCDWMGVERKFIPLNKMLDYLKSGGDIDTGSLSKGIDYLGRIMQSKVKSDPTTSESINQVLNSLM